MQMQTGPGPRQAMHNWLLWTGVLEIINIGIFAFVIWQIDQATQGFIGPLTITGFATLAVVLLEGGLYWIVKRTSLLNGITPLWRVRLLKALYVANVILLLIFPIVALGVLVRGAPPLGIGDAVVGTALYLFGVGEFIHYFVWKINMRGRERRRQRKTARRIPARFRRELERAQRAAATAR